MTAATFVRGRGPRGGGGVLLLALLALAGACAKSPDASQPLPRHPFPRWVSELATDQTSLQEVHLLFGEPKEIEQTRSGKMIWRYAYSEIHFAPSDPDRPRVAADGTRHPRRESVFTRASGALLDFGRFFDRLVSYPPTQPRRPAARRLPATVHDLELVFSPEGRVERYRYAPRAAFVQVRPPR